MIFDSSKSWSPCDPWGSSVEPVPASDPPLGSSGKGRAVQQEWGPKAHCAVKLNVWGKKSKKKKKSVQKCLLHKMFVAFFLSLTAIYLCQSLLEPAPDFPCCSLLSHVPHPLSASTLFPAHSTLHRALLLRGAGLCPHQQIVGLRSCTSSLSLLRCVPCQLY